MIKQLMIVILFSFCYMQGTFGGYAIFDYSNESGSDGFDLKRVYLSYNNNISDDLFLKIRYDVGRHADDRLTTFLKNAYVDYKFENGDKLSIGLIGTNSILPCLSNIPYKMSKNTHLHGYTPLKTNTAHFGL